MNKQPSEELPNNIHWIHFFYFIPDVFTNGHKFHENIFLTSLLIENDVYHKYHLQQKATLNKQVYTISIYEKSGFQAPRCQLNQPWNLVSDSLEGA